jgi:hypothetical protein
MSLAAGNLFCYSLAARPGTGVLPAIFLAKTPLMDGGLRMRAAAVALLLGMALASGCAPAKSGLLAQWNPFYKEDVYDPRQYGPTIDERLEEIRKLADRAEDMTPAEREQVSQDLGRRLQYETSPATKLTLDRALARFDTPMADAALRMALSDPEPQIRRTAVQAWGQRRTPQAVQALGQALASDTDLDVRIAAAAELGNFQDRAAIEALGVGLDDPDPALQYRSIQSLRTATGKDYGGDVAAWRIVVQGGQPTDFERPSMVQSWFNWF